MPEVYKKGAWKRAVKLDSGKLVPVALRSTGSIHEPKIELQYFGEPLDKKEKQDLTEKLDNIFSFSQDLTKLYRFMEQNPEIADLKNRFMGLKAAGFGVTVFECFVKSIIQQQISIKVAYSITNKMVTRFGESIQVENRIYYDFPTPEKFSKISLEQIRNCGVSWRKAECIKEISNQVVNKEFDIEGLVLLSNKQVTEALKQFRGVGTWTAEMVLFAGLKRSTAIPAGDLGVRRTVSKFYSDAELLTEAQVRKIAEKWGEFTNDVVYYISCIERT
ncbi:MAG: DNA-3-methyladenine glycosylase family protein [archaeon]